MPIINATILIAVGKIQSIGPKAKITVPTGYVEIDHAYRFAMHRLIDARSRVGGTGDINEMVYQTNPDLRVLDVIRPNEDRLKIAVAGGVTTITFIPGSDANMGGWDALMKTGPGKLPAISPSARLMSASARSAALAEDRLLPRRAAGRSLRVVSWIR